MYFVYLFICLSSGTGKQGIPAQTLIARLNQAVKASCLDEDGAWEIGKEKVLRL